MGCCNTLVALLLAEGLDLRALEGPAATLGALQMTAWAKETAAHGVGDSSKSCSARASYIW
jgi:hypothetical protein